jgi:hypothetical protein
MAMPPDSDLIDPVPPRGRRRRRSSDPTRRMARGMAEGFAEASQAFADELEDTDDCADLIENAMAGFIRANARFLDELAGTIRRTADDLDVRSRRRGDEIDYELLAEMVAARLRGPTVVTPPTPPTAPNPPTPSTA